MPEPVVRPLSIDGVMVVEPTPFRDDRGFFVRTMNAEVLAAAGIDSTGFVHENQSRSRQGTLRGLHCRAALSESKLVRCAHGALFEAIVDLRPWSRTYLRVETIVLDDIDHRQVYVPAGCAHGFQALTATIDVCYKHDAAYDAPLERAIRYDDCAFSIPWPLAEPTISDRDRDAPSFADVEPLLGEWFGTMAPA
jgi:dTDP-4-dehydrorhamnose 3,5-epimerase